MAFSTKGYKNQQQDGSWWDMWEFLNPPKGQNLKKAKNRDDLVKQYARYATYSFLYFILCYALGSGLAIFNLIYHALLSIAYMQIQFAKFGFIGLGDVLYEILNTCCFGYLKRFSFFDKINYRIFKWQPEDALVIKKESYFQKKLFAFMVISTLPNIAGFISINMPFLIKVASWFGLYATNSWIAFGLMLLGEFAFCFNLVYLFYIPYAIYINYRYVETVKIEDIIDLQEKLSACNKSLATKIKNKESELNKLVIAHESYEEAMATQLALNEQEIKIRAKIKDLKKQKDNLPTGDLISKLKDIEKQINEKEQELAKVQKAKTTNIKALRKLEQSIDRSEVKKLEQAQIKIRHLSQVLTQKPSEKLPKSLWEGTGFDFAESLSYYQEKYGAIGNVMLSAVLFKNFLFNGIIVLDNWYQICFYAQNICDLADLTAIGEENCVYLDAALEKIKELKEQDKSYQEINDALQVLFDEFAEKDQLMTEIVNAQAIMAAEYLSGKEMERIAVREDLESWFDVSRLESEGKRNAEKTFAESVEEYEDKYTDFEQVFPDIAAQRKL